MSDQKTEPEVCCVEGCGKPRKWKGLCQTCYGMAKRVIDNGDAKDWEELYDMGLCLLDDKPFMKMFKIRKKQREEEKQHTQIPSEPVELKISQQ